MNSEEGLLANLLNQEEDISHAQDSYVPISLSPKGSYGTQEPPSAQSLGLPGNQNQNVKYCIPKEPKFYGASHGK